MLSFAGAELFHKYINGTMALVFKYQRP